MFQESVTPKRATLWMAFLPGQGIHHRREQSNKQFSYTCDFALRSIRTIFAIVDYGPCEAPKASKTAHNIRPELPAVSRELKIFLLYILICLSITMDTELLVTGFALSHLHCQHYSSQDNGRLIDEDVWDDSAKTQCLHRIDEYLKRFAFYVTFYCLKQRETTELASDGIKPSNLCISALDLFLKYGFLVLQDICLRTTSTDGSGDQLIS
ncbi:hypothetical protein M514_15904 [Trichuris suis]|uniref:Uncharacterized protein n=1 Tax=Trichuris suis TaxID=68888 RepID=A0A085NQP8_9BILA|nr:hypothetical protein M514_15904 [Trichuris suis]